MRRATKVLAAAWIAVFMVMGDGLVRGAHAEDKLSWSGRAALVRYENVQNPHSTYDETVWTIRAAASRFHVSSAIMLCIGRRESGSTLDEGAINHNGGPGDALGIFQHIRRYWPGRVDFYNARVGKWLKVAPNASAFSMRANSLVSARMMHTGGFGPWAGEGCST